MRRLAAIVSSLMLLNGCSIYHAITAPEPVDYKNVTLGQQRAETVSILGSPKNSEVKPDVTTDIFEFTDGYNAASKSRVILYAAGDLFTLGTAEIVFWPLEWGLLQGEKMRGIVAYDGESRVNSYIFTANDGTQRWVAQKAPVVAARPEASATEPTSLPQETALVVR